VLLNMQNTLLKVKCLLKRKVERHQLFFANIGVSFGLSGLGDVIQQRIETKQNHSSMKTTSSVNWRRTLNMSTSFGLTSGVLCHHWYLYLDKLLPGRGIKTIMTKIAWDQVIFSPVLITACILVSGYVENKSMAQFFQDTVDLGSRLWLAECLLWPPAQFINFYFLPTKYRVLYDNLVSLVYDWYTSRLKHSMDQTKEQDKEESIQHSMGQCNNLRQTENTRIVSLT